MLKMLIDETEKKIKNRPKKTLCQLDQFVKPVAWVMKLR
jgi:hypothetical protein